MRFLITCDNCDYQFLADGESHQTVQCQCPHCGGLMKVKLPEPSATEPNEEAPVKPHRKKETTQEEPPRRRTGCGIVIGIFLGLFIIVLAATIYYSLTQHESTQRIEDPFAHAYDDTASYNEALEEVPVEEVQLDTVQQHIEATPEETDSLDVEAEIEPTEEAAETEPSAEPTETPAAPAAEPAPKAEQPQNNN